MPSELGRIQTFEPASFRERNSNGDLSPAEVEQYDNFSVQSPSPHQNDFLCRPTENFPGLSVMRRCFDLLSQGDQGLVKLMDDVMSISVAASVIQLRLEKRDLVLRVNGTIRPPECLEFLSAPLAHRLDEVRIGMAHEVRKRGRLSVFLAHEQQRDER